MGFKLTCQRLRNCHVQCFKIQRRQSTTKGVSVTWSWRCVVRPGSSRIVLASPQSLWGFYWQQWGYMAFFYMAHSESHMQNSKDYRTSMCFWEALWKSGTCFFWSCWKVCGQTVSRNVFSSLLNNSNNTERPVHIRKVRIPRSHIPNNCPKLHDSNDPCIFELQEVTPCHDQ